MSSRVDGYDIRSKLDNDLLICKYTGWSARLSQWNFKKNFEKKKHFNLNFLAYVIPGIPLGSLKKFSPFGPVVWSDLGKIYTNVMFYYIGDKFSGPLLNKFLYTTLVWSMAKAKRYGVINLTGTYSSLRDSWIQKQSRYSGIRHKTCSLDMGIVFSSVSQQSRFFYF